MLRIIPLTFHQKGVSFPHTVRGVLRCHVGLAIARCNPGGAIGSNFHAHRRQPHRTHCRQLRADLRLPAAGTEHTPRHHATANLNLDTIVFQIPQANLGIRSHTNEIRVIELYFRTAVVTHGERITHHERRIHCRGNPLAGIATLHLGVAAEDAQASHLATRFIRRSIGIRGRRRLGKRKSGQKSQRQKVSSVAHIGIL